MKYILQVKYFKCYVVLRYTHHLDGMGRCDCGGVEQASSVELPRVR